MARHGGRMKTVSLLLCPVSAFVAVVFVAVMLWMRADVEVVHPNDAPHRVVGGMTPAEVRELIN